MIIKQITSFLIALLFTYSTYCVAGSQTSILGNNLPGFTLSDVNGKPHSSSQWKNKIIVINFWATWCTPCQKEIPLFNKFQNEFADEVQFVGIALDNIKSVRKFNLKIPIEYVNLIAEKDSVQLIQQLGNKSGVLPYTVFVNKAGKIFQAASGKLTHEFLLNTLEKAL